MLGKLSWASRDTEQPLAMRDASTVLSVVRIKITSRHCHAFLGVVTLVDHSDRESHWKDSEPYRMLPSVGMAEGHHQRGELGR